MMKSIFKDKIFKWIFSSFLVIGLIVLVPALSNLSSFSDAGEEQAERIVQDEQKIDENHIGGYYKGISGDLDVQIRINADGTAEGFYKVEGMKRPYIDSNGDLQTTNGHYVLINGKIEEIEDEIWLRVWKVGDTLPLSGGTYMEDGEVDVLKSILQVARAKVAYGMGIRPDPSVYKKFSAAEDPYGFKENQANAHIDHGGYNRDYDQAELTRDFLDDLSKEFASNSIGDNSKRWADFKYDGENFLSGETRLEQVDSLDKVFDKDRESWLEEMEDYLLSDTDWEDFIQVFDFQMVTFVASGGREALKRIEDDPDFSYSLLEDEDLAYLGLTADDSYDSNLGISSGDTDTSKHYAYRIDGLGELYHYSDREKNPDARTTYIFYVYWTPSSGVGISASNLDVDMFYRVLKDWKNWEGSDLDVED